MPIKNPNTPYERAYNAWSYGGGQQRGEPMPRARDFPSSDSWGPRLPRPKRVNPWLMPDAATQQYGGMLAQHGDVKRGQEQRRLAESPDVVQRARAYEQRRRQPQGGPGRRISLGALNRR